MYVRQAIELRVLLLLLLRLSFLTSDQRISTRGRIAGADFSRGTMQCDTDQFGALQPVGRSPAVAVIDFLLRKLPQHRLPVLFSGPDNPQNCPIPWESGSHGSLGAWAHPNRPPNGISIGSAVFGLQGRAHECDQQTDRQTDRSRNGPNLASAMRTKKNLSCCSTDRLSQQIESQCDFTG